MAAHGDKSTQQGSPWVSVNVGGDKSVTAQSAAPCAGNLLTQGFKKQTMNVVGRARYNGGTGWKDAAENR